MSPGIVVAPMRPDQVAAAKRTILSVAATVYPVHETEEAWIARMIRENVLNDVDNHAEVYTPPDGNFLVAMDGHALIGTAALRRLEATTAELKRMWLLPAYHGRGIGYALARGVLDFAVAAGYRRVRLSTQFRQERAIAFYRSLGFYEIERYNDLDDELFFQLDLEHHDDAERARGR